MVNPNFIKLANRLKSDKPPEPRKPNSGLTNILERDEKRKPKLSLTPLEKTAVHTPTQESYWDLIRVYECGGWRWGGVVLPTQANNWRVYKEETCVEAGVDYFSGGKYDNGKFCFGSRGLHQEENWKIIPPQEFYDAQTPPITPEMINEINKWFDENGK